jgi:hypothetical protein
VIARALALASILALAAGGLPSAAEEGQAKVRVALDRLRTAGVPDAFAAAVEERLCAALGARAELEVVCPSDVAAATVLARNAALFGECRSDECMKRVEAVKAADQRVSGAVEKGAEGIVLSLQLTRADGPGPRVVERLPDDLDAVLARVPALVKRLLAR